MRKVNNLTGEEVANRLGIHTFTLYGWERGDTEPKISQAMKLAEIYGCTVYDIYWYNMDKDERTIRKQTRKEQKMTKAFKEIEKEWKGKGRQ